MICPAIPKATAQPQQCSCPRSADFLPPESCSEVILDYLVYSQILKSNFEVKDNLINLPILLSKAPPNSLVYSKSQQGRSFSILLGNLPFPKNLTTRVWDVFGLSGRYGEKIMTCRRECLGRETIRMIHQTTHPRLCSSDALLYVQIRRRPCTCQKSGGFDTARTLSSVFKDSQNQGPSKVHL